MVALNLRNFKPEISEYVWRKLKFLKEQVLIFLDKAYPEILFF
jgi:hypothetical protein